MGKIISNGKQYSGGSALHNYSLNEHVIGTWIDGKPLYEKTFNVSSVTADDTWQEIANVDLKLLINFECISYSSTESGKETSFNNSKNAPQIKGNSSSGKLFYALVAGTSITGLYVTARYTKITD